MATSENSQTIRVEDTTTLQRALATVRGAPSKQARFSLAHNEQRHRRPTGRCRLRRHMRTHMHRRWSKNILGWGAVRLHEDRNAQAALASSRGGNGQPLTKVLHTVSKGRQGARASTGSSRARKRASAGSSLAPVPVPIRIQRYDDKQLHAIPTIQVCPSRFKLAQA